MMGWWKPYFFTDIEGVQVLFEWAKIDGLSSWTFLIASSVVALLSLLDRWAAHYAIHKLRQESIFASTALWTLQRCTSGLLMLIMMSFNTVLFAQVVIFSGLAELGARLYWTSGSDAISFQRLAQNQIEITECC